MIGGDISRGMTKDYTPFILAIMLLVFTTMVSFAWARNESSSLMFAVRLHFKTWKRQTAFVDVSEVSDAAA